MNQSVWFNDTFSHLYERVYPSVGRSTGWLLSYSVRLSHASRNDEITPFFNTIWSYCKYCSYCPQTSTNKRTRSLENASIVRPLFDVRQSVPPAPIRFAHSNYGNNIARKIQIHSRTQQSNSRTLHEGIERGRPSASRQKRRYFLW